MVKKKPIRPPRVQVNKKGKRYFKYKNKKIYVSSKISQADLIKWIIKRFHRKRKRVGPKKVQKELAQIHAPKNAIYSQLLDPNVAPINYLKALRKQVGISEEEARREAKKAVEKNIPNVPLIAPPSKPSEPPKGHTISDREYDDLQKYYESKNLLGEETAEERSKRHIAEDEAERAHGETAEERSKRHVAEDEAERSHQSAVKHKIDKVKITHEQVLDALDKGSKKYGIQPLDLGKLRDIASLAGVKTTKPSKKNAKKKVARNKVDIINDLVDEGQDVIIQAYEEARKKIADYIAEKHGEKEQKEGKESEEKDKKLAKRTLTFQADLPKREEPRPSLTVGPDIREQQFESTQQEHQQRKAGLRIPGFARPAPSTPGPSLLQPPQTPATPVITIRHEIIQPATPSVSELLSSGQKQIERTSQLISESDRAIKKLHETYQLKPGPPPGPPQPPNPLPPSEEPPDLIELNERYLESKKKAPEPRGFLASIKEKIGKLKKPKPKKEGKKEKELKDIVQPSEALKQHLEARRVNQEEPFTNVNEDQWGEGKTDQVMSGLYNDQIDKTMSHYQNYMGAIANDEIETKVLPRVKPHSRGSFVMNLDPSNKPGSHWVAIYWDARPSGSHSIEYFDSFGRRPQPGVAVALKKLAEKLGTDEYMKLKVNHVVDQRNNSQSCGYLAMLFLKDRYAGRDFKSASGYSSKTKAEQRAVKMKDQLGFGYI